VDTSPPTRRLSRTVAAGTVARHWSGHHLSVAPREREVLCLLANGRIARQPGLTPRTVANVATFLVRLRARDRAVAVLAARGAGVDDP
jgi:DNA-binding NarL/FixJ family response regulator